MYDQPTLWDLGNVISSQGSRYGRSRSSRQAGPGVNESGQPVCLASPGVQQAEEKALPTSDTCGQSSLSLSEPVGLTSSLESKSAAVPSSELSNKLAESMKRRLTYGSMEYAQTWKQHTTPQGRVLWGHIPSDRRREGSGSTGWPTPNAGPQNDGDTTWEQRRVELKKKHGNGNGFGMTLGQASTTSPWPTPRAQEPGHTNDTHGMSVTDIAKTVGWVSPSSRDWKDSPGMATEALNPDGSVRHRVDQLPRQEQLTGWHTPDTAPTAPNKGTNCKNVIAGLGNQAIGTIMESSNAETAKAVAFPKAVLNPYFSAWLMSIPKAWIDAGRRAVATRLRAKPSQAGLPCSKE